MCVSVSEHRVCAIGNESGCVLRMDDYAYYVSTVAPTALVFSPCVDGITHNEAEDILFEPTIEAVNVFFDAVVARADR